MTQPTEGAGPSAPAAPPTEDFDPVAGEPVSGMQRLVGYRLEDWREGYCRVRLAIEGRHRNRYGATHGGIYATLADAAGGFSGCYPERPDERRRCVTLSLTTNYLAQPADDVMIAESRVTGGGRSVFFATIEIRDGAGTLLSTATGTFRYRNPVPRTPPG